MKPTKAFNIDLMELTREKLNHLFPVKVVDIYDGVTNNFHEDGLFSTKIFGEVGSERRDVTFAYIKLNTKIFNPNIYNRIKKLKRLYDEIMMGVRYAVFDESIKDFVPSTPLEGETGYSFFMKHWDKINLKKNNSSRRNIMIDVIVKNKDKIFLENFLVLPAGLRDFYIDQNGKKSEDEVNDMYRRMISIANSLELIPNSNSVVQDTARRNLQRIANEINDYFEGLFTGKKGFAQAKWGGRTVFNGTRNVITSMDVSAEELGSERSPTINDTFLSLYQVIKGALPLTVHLIRNSRLYQASFTGDQEYVYLINKETLKREQVKIDQWVIDNWQSTEGLEKLIDRYGLEDVRDKYISISGHWFGLIYKDEEKFQILTDIDELPEGWDKNNVHPINLVEFLYLIGYRKYYELKTTVTRYPISGLGSIYPSNVYVKTTTTARALREYVNGEPIEGDEGIAREFPYYPKGSKPIHQNSSSPHSSRLSGLGADKRF